MIQISKYISYSEAVTSQTAIRKKIDNNPTQLELANMQFVATEVFDRIREHFGVPLRVSSFYRCQKLNKAVGGSKTSQHVEGQAIDIQGIGNVTNSMIFDYVKNYLKFDQLIWEFGNSDNPAWVHVSLTKGKNRNQIIHVN